MFEDLAFYLSVSALLVASYTDLKSRIIPNKISYGLIGTGLLLAVARTYFESDSTVLGVFLGITLLSFFFALLLHRVGLWAGGDVKLFTGLAALNPVNHAFLARSLDLSFGGVLVWPVFPLTLFFFSVLAMLPYGVALCVWAFARRRELRQKLLEKAFHRGHDAFYWVAALLGFRELLLLFGIHEAFALAGLALLGFLPKNVGRWAGLALFVVLLVRQGVAGGLEAVALAAGLLAIYVLIQTYFLGKKEAFQENVSVEKLWEGAIPAQDLVEEKNRLALLPEPSFRVRVKRLLKGDVSLGAKPGRGQKLFAGNRNANGLEKDQIVRVQREAAAGRFPETLPVKAAAPMVPAILLAYVFLQLAGDAGIAWLLALQG